MESRKPSYSFLNAVTDLQNAGFPAKEQAYGFSLVLQDSETRYSVECGHEHGGGISISVDSGTPPVRWFLCPSIQEIVNLLIEANELLKSGQADNWINALNKIEPMVM